jgi:membrane peptidoglycan carboxypeptidase
VRRLARANNTALVVLDVPTGQVLAMVGSKDFWGATIHGQVNLALAGRQPGSAIKPVVYLAGFERGLHPAKVLKYVGVPAFQDMARRLGITTLDRWDPRWLSITLGGGEVRLLELVNAYATIAREGVYRPVEPLLRVETARGAVLYEAPAAPPGEQVVDPRVAYQLLHVMGDVGARLATFGPRSPLHLARPHMVKTGTTDDYRDTWTLGCLPQVCVGVWMGNTDNRPMAKVSSSLTAGQLWRDMVEALIRHYQYEPLEFPRPDGVIVRRARNVGATRPGQTDHEEVFLPGHEAPFLLEMDWRRPD